MASVRACEPARYSHIYRRAEPYGEFVCTYCGDPCDSDDHVLPLSYLGALDDLLPVLLDSLLPLLVIVPACRSCNSLAGDFVCTSITDKREHIHKKLRKKNAALLGSYDWQAEDLKEIGRGLRDMILNREHKRNWLLSRLAWPGDAVMTDFSVIEDYEDAVTPHYVKPNSSCTRCGVWRRAGQRHVCQMVQA